MYSLSFSHEFLSIEESQSWVEYRGGCFVEAGFGLCMTQVGQGNPFLVRGDSRHVLINASV